MALADPFQEFAESTAGWASWLTPLSLAFLSRLTGVPWIPLTDVSETDDAYLERGRAARHLKGQPQRRDERPGAAYHRRDF